RRALHPRAGPRGAPAPRGDHLRRQGPRGAPAGGRPPQGRRRGRRRRPLRRAGPRRAPPARRAPRHGARDRLPAHLQRRLPHPPALLLGGPAPQRRRMGVLRAGIAAPGSAGLITRTGHPDRPPGWAWKTGGALANLVVIAGLAAVALSV